MVTAVTSELHALFFENSNKIISLNVQVTSYSSYSIFESLAVFGHHALLQRASLYLSMFKFKLITNYISNL